MTTATIRLSHAARNDISEILRFTQVQFGDAARRRYQGLLQAALRSISESPEQAGSCKRTEVAAGLRSLHLMHCRSVSTAGRVARPRHLILYRQQMDQVVEVVRVLHDAMELSKHLPQDIPR
ncbi:type II toxin-antitoxin system RelE/ParE family toxin [Pseudomonas sp. BW16M2]|uniref:type II toxin-antitoxin system RelE/ParE family toxin n=1 Tax=Pseudomonas sp. BW16M2 TaxID=2745489 RepID=UPI001644730D|nr:type II toxin-antitoxin system RelE/ParE family toxin [Pseudomonas sp. BW16M2]MBC3435853.1 type II toxin-antitoxin system RelE/ParE family toxin [Pseudomonas sp. BW16M2]